MADASPDLFFFKDSGSTYRYVNRAFCDLFGIAASDIEGRTDDDIFPATSARRHRQADQAVLTSGRSQTFEYMVEHGGRAVWLQVLKTPIFDASGQVSGVFCVARNITALKSVEDSNRHTLKLLERDVADQAEDLRRTNEELRRQVKERLKAEKALEESHRSLNCIFENSPIGIAFVTDRIVRRANPRFNNLFSLEPGGAVGLPTAAFYPDAESYESFGRQYYPILGQGERVDVVRVMRRGDGSDFWCRIIGQVLDASRPQDGSIWLMEDVTERRMAEEATLAADRLKREFMDNMSHEVRTPLNGILGMAEVLSAAVEDAEQRAMVETLKESGRTLATLLENVLDFARLDAGDVVTRRAPFGLANILEGVASSFAGAALQKGLALSWRVDAAAPELVVGDGGGLRQILTALVSNAVKFTAAGDIEILAELAGSSVPAGEEAGPVRLAFSVRDTGIGLDPEQVNTIFEPFRQADGSKTRRYGGAGLGLAIAGKLAAAMGGSLSVESRPGQGSLFRFTAPFDPADSPSS
jgi:PAS domain S-box-containing protein